MSDFPHIPKPHIRSVLASNMNFYAPAYFALRQQMNMLSKPFKLKATPTRLIGKGKRHDQEFERERAWLVQKLASDGSHPGVLGSIFEDEECEDGIECGCCFSVYAFVCVCFC